MAICCCSGAAIAIYYIGCWGGIIPIAGACIAWFIYICGALPNKPEPGAYIGMNCCIFICGGEALLAFDISSGEELLI